MNNYFESITEACDELDRQGNEYIDRFDFIPNDEICKRIWNAANKIFKDSGEEWNLVPEWVANTMDGWMPYANIPRNGSLFFSLGFSCVSQDAHLRNLLEIAEGRETKWLDFDCLVDKDELHKQLDLA